MAPAPESFTSFLTTTGYHPRTDAHSNHLALAIVEDLLKHCPRIRQGAADGTVVYDLNFVIFTGTAEWKVDLVIGKPALGGATPPVPPNKIVRAKPSLVEIAVELKGVMTEHRKAVKNRKRDFEAHHDHVHRYNPKTIAGALLVINGAEKFRSPLRPEITTHKNVDKLVKHCVEQARAVSVRSSTAGIGLDAKAVVVVEYQNEPPESVARYITTPPAPGIGDPMNYDAFIQTICALYTERF
jgi:hypothetical protein